MENGLERISFAARDFTERFASIYEDHPKDAVCGFIGNVVTILAMMHPDNRLTVTKTLSDLFMQMSNVHFEDGTDFLQFLKDSKLGD